MTLQAEILDGLNRSGWDDSIRTVKQVVANALRALDRTAEIKDTTYFNHSFVPDFVLTWPREQNRTRDVFLRLDTSEQFLLGDLKYLSETGPLLLGLADLPAEEERLQSAVAAAGDRPEKAKRPTMVTEPGAIDELQGAGSSRDFGHVVPAAVLKGGRGVMTSETAEDMTAAAEVFFGGARQHDPEAVRSTVPSLDQFLDDRQTSRLLNLGRIIWEATGGDPTSFPTPTELAGVDDAGLRFLLEEAPSDDPAFWRSVGRHVSLERLIGLGVHEGPTLAAFVRSNADRLYARALFVRGTQPRLDAGGPEWAVEAKALALRGSDFVAYLPARRDDLAVGPENGRGLEFAEFQRRTSAEQVETVTVITPDSKTVKIASEDMFDPGTDQVLASVGDLPGARVASVGILSSGKHLECDFTNGLATGHTNASFDVASLLERALPLLWPLRNPADVEEIRRVRRTVSQVSLSPSLFDELGE